MKKISAILIILLAGLLAAGCAGGKTPAVNVPVDDIYDSIKEQIVADLREVGYQDADFAAEELPGYIVYDLKGENAEQVLAPLNKDDVQEGFVIKAAMMLNSDQIAIIKAAEGKVETIKAALEDELEAQNATWSQYLPDQAAKVTNTIISVQGDYVIYITYADAEAVEEIFLNALK